MNKEQAQEIITLAKNELGNVAKGLKEALDTQAEELKSFGETSKATADKIKALDERYDSTNQDLKEAMDRLKELEVKLSRGNIFSEEDVEEMLSPGQLFAKAEYAQEMERDGLKASKRLKLKGFNRYRGVTGLNIGAKAVSRFDTDGTTRLLLPQRTADVLLPEREMRLRDLLRVETTSSDSIQYIQEVGFAPFMTRVNVATSSGDTTVVVDLAEGMHVGQVIKIDGMTGTRTVTNIDTDTNTITLNATVGAVVAKGEAVTSMTLGAHIETKTKPQSDITFTLKTESFRTLAHWIPAPRQVLRDIPRLENYIDRRLMYGLELTEEHHILYGDGSDRMLQGILTHTNRQTASWSGGVVGDTQIDAIRRAATKGQLAEYSPNGFVIHPNDWEDIELMKGSDKHYIWINVQEGGTTRLWRMPAVTTQAIAEGTVALGAWNMASVLYDLEAANIRVAEQHANFFIENMVAILAEESLIFVHERPEAYVHLTLDTAPS